MGAAQPGPGARQGRVPEAAQLAGGVVPAAAGAEPADASATKVFGTEFAVEAYRLLMEVLGAARRGAVGLARRGAGRAGSSGRTGPRSS